MAARRRPRDRITFANANGLTLILNAGSNYLADRSKRWQGAHPHARLTRGIDAAGNMGMPCTPPMWLISGVRRCSFNTRDI